MGQIKNIKLHIVTDIKRMSNKVKVTIQVTSDLACPWCYVALRRLENAMEQLKESLEVRLHWHPYMIDMKTQPDGEDYMKYNQRRWGSDGWVRGMKDSALADGARFENWGRHNPNSEWANTMNAHRLLYFVQTKCSMQRMDKMKRKLFHEYYEKGVNISLVDELIVIGKQCNLSVRDADEEEWNGGITDTELEELMKSSTLGHSEVLGEDSDAKRRGISGVPYFEVSRHVVNGAQSSKHWIKIFKAILDS